MSVFTCIDDGYLTASENMQKDKVLFKNVNPDEVILRFYKWTNFSVTFGISRKAENDLDKIICQQNNLIPCVRPTGGGIVFHGDKIDFTYSLILGKNISDKFLTNNNTKNYQVIHTLLIKALMPLGVSPSLCDEKIDNSMPESCFLRFAKNDILIENKKIAGAAQRISKTGFLHQGYLSLNYKDCSKYLKNTTDTDFSKYTYPLLNILNTEDKLNLLKSKITKEIKNFFI